MAFCYGCCWLFRVLQEIEVPREKLGVGLLSLGVGLLSLGVQIWATILAGFAGFGKMRQTKGSFLLISLVSPRAWLGRGIRI